MKIRIKTHNGKLPSYLTVGKVYEVVKKNGYTDPERVWDAMIGVVDE